MVIDKAQMRTPPPPHQPNCAATPVTLSPQTHTPSSALQYLEELAAERSALHGSSAVAPRRLTERTAHVLLVTNLGMPQARVKKQVVSDCGTRKLLIQLHDGLQVCMCVWVEG